MARIFQRVVASLRGGPRRQGTIQRSDVAQRAIRGLHLKDRAPLSDLNPELQGVIVIEDLTSNVGILPSTERPVPCSGFASQGAVVAQFATVVLVNAVDPRWTYDFIVDEIWPDTSANGNVTIAILPQSGGATPGFVEDTRITPQQSSRGLIGISSEVAVHALPQLQLAVLSTDTPRIAVNFVISPGFMLSVQSVTGNSAFVCAFRWREYERVKK